MASEFCGIGGLASDFDRFSDFRELDFLERRAGGVSVESFEVAFALSDFFLDEPVLVGGDERPASSECILLILSAGCVLIEAR